MNQERYVDTRHMLVSVDVQNDFITGTLAVEGGVEVVTPLNTLAHAVRRDLGRVAFTRDWHPATTPHFDTWAARREPVVWAATHTTSRTAQ